MSQDIYSTNYEPSQSNSINKLKISKKLDTIFTKITEKCHETKIEK